MTFLHFHRGLGRSLGLLLICTMMLSTAGAAMGQSDPGQDLEELFLPALNLNSNGQFEAAAANIREILATHRDDDQVTKRAYDYLFLVLYMDPDPAADGKLVAAINDALLRYPDLVPDVAYCPPEVVTNVKIARLQMYGSLQITNPEGAEIILDGESRGMSPLVLEFLPVGKYDLTIAKDGYQEREEVITIEPGSILSRDVELSKKSNTAWYIAGGTALLAGTLYLIFKKDKIEDEPLAEPPPPPGY